MSEISRDFLVLYTGVIILINLILLSYVLKLEREKCDCSDDWMRDYIKYYTSGIVILSLIVLVIPVLTSYKSLVKFSKLFTLIRIVVLIATLVQVYCVFVYSQGLNCKKKSCECSVDWRSNFMYFLGIFGLVIYTLMIVAYLICSFAANPSMCFN